MGNEGSVDLNQYLKEQDASDEGSVDLHQYLAQNNALSPEEKLRSYSKKLGEADKVRFENAVNTAVLDHLPHFRAKVGQVLAGEGISNNEDYVKRRDQAISEMKQGEANYPGAAQEGKAVGFLAPMLLSGGGSAAIEGAEALTEAAPFISNLIKGTAKSAATAGAYAGLQNPGDIEGEVSPIQLGERIGNAGEGALFGAKIGAGASLLAASPSAIKASSKWIAPKFGKVVANIPEETTARYIENPNAVNEALPREHIADKIMEMKNSADNDVLSAHGELLEAKDRLLEAKEAARTAIGDEKARANEALKSAQAVFDGKAQIMKENLQKSNLTGMASHVADASQELRSVRDKGSKEAYALLEQHSGSFDTKPLIDTLDKHIESLKINGIPESDLAEKTINQLESEKSRLTQMGKDSGGMISGPQAKQYIQGLDKVTNFGTGGAAEILPDTDQAYQAVRKSLDQNLKKNVNGYEKKMESVSRQTRLLNDVDKNYGTPQKAISALNNIDSEKGQAVHFPIIKALEKETGKQFSPEIEKYIEGQKILKTPSLFDSTLNATPEARALLARQIAKDAAFSPEFAKKIQQGTLSGPELAKAIREEMLAKRKGEAEVFSGLTNQTVMGKTRKLGGQDSYGAEKLFANIDKQKGTNLSQEIQARNDADQFTKTDTAGSRKTMLGSLTGFIIGTLMGHPLAGTEIGVAGGAAMDKFSGQATKGIIDAGIGIGNGAKKVGNFVNKVGAPTSVPQIAQAGARMNVTPVEEKRGPQAWANSGYNKIMEHSKNDPAIESAKQQMLTDPKMKDLLMQASDLKPGSKAMDDILDKIRKRLPKGEK